VGEDILIFAVLVTGAVLVITQIGRLWRASIQHKTIREAIIRESAAVPELLAGVEEAKPSGSNDDRTAFVLLAIALALFLSALIQGDPDDLRNMGSAALFPALVGVALLIRHHLARRRDPRP
jgi:peptidoglycan/LPS O-acetylase OafA/YrhL